MSNNEIEKATKYLQEIPRINNLKEATNYIGDVLLLPQNVEFKVTKDSLIETHGLGDKLDKKVRDLISVISIEDALNIKYKQTNILTPLMYAESLSDILWHLNTQGILFTRLSTDSINWIKKQTNYIYMVNIIWINFGCLVAKVSTV